MITNLNETILKINNDEKIIIKHRNSLNTIYCDFEDDIIFRQKNSEILLSHSFLYHNLEELIILLKKALQNNLILSDLITQDLGFLFNQYSAEICGEKLEKPTHLTYITQNNEQHWPGNDYSLWENDFVSWIYNTPDGSIVFEITPFYPYMYCEPEEEPDYIPYEEWIKTYKPYFITTLSPETAEQWIEQAERIIRIIEFNEKRIHHRSKIDVES